MAADVDWGALWSRTGPADWVPAALDDLAAADPARAREAATTLEVGLLDRDESGAFDATLAAVPRLVDIAASPAAAGRAAALCLLRDLATFALPDYCATPFSLEAIERPGFDVDTERAVAAAVRDATPTWLRMLGDGDAGVRAAAAQLLGVFAGGPAAALEAAARDPVARVRASAVLALARHARAGATVDEAPLRAAASSDDLLERSAGALALGMLHGADMPDDVYDLLEETTLAPLPGDYAFWYEGRLQDAASALFDAVMPID